MVARRPAVPERERRRRGARAPVAHRGAAGVFSDGGEARTAVNRRQPVSGKKRSVAVIAAVSGRLAGGGGRGERGEADGVVVGGGGGARVRQPDGIVCSPRARRRPTGSFCV